jgi:uridine phosphorylase
MLGPVSEPQSDHIRPTAPIAPDVILPGDPGRALALAQALLSSPLMSNHHRGLWGYSGNAPGGRELTIQASGIGGPSLAVVVEELALHGARRFLRLGTCRSLSPSASLGDILIVGDAIAGEGASRALGAGERTLPDASLHAALLASAGAGAKEASVLSTDLVHVPAGEPQGAEALAADLGTATLFAWGAQRERPVAAGLIVSLADGERLSDERLEGLSLELGQTAVAALERRDQPSATSEPGTEARA